MEDSATLTLGAHLCWVMKAWLARRMASSAPLNRNTRSLSSLVLGLATSTRTSSSITPHDTASSLKIISQVENITSPFRSPHLAPGPWGTLSKWQLTRMAGAGAGREALLRRTTTLVTPW